MSSLKIGNWILNTSNKKLFDLTSYYTERNVECSITCYQLFLLSLLLLFTSLKEGIIIHWEINSFRLQAGAQFRRSWCNSSICKPLRVGGNRIDIDDIGECGMNCFRITNALALARSLNHSLKGLGWLVACIFFVFALPTRSLARSLTHSLANSLTHLLTRRSPWS